MWSRLSMQIYDYMFTLPTKPCNRYSCYCPFTCEKEFTAHNSGRPWHHYVFNALKICYLFAEKDRYSVSMVICVTNPLQRIPTLQDPISVHLSDHLKQSTHKTHLKHQWNDIGSYLPMKKKKDRRVNKDEAQSILNKNPFHNRRWRDQRFSILKFSGLNDHYWVFVGDRFHL